MIDERTLARDGTRTPLAGKSALVTGGARGIGSACVRALVAAGADVAFSYVDSSGKAKWLADELGNDDARVIPIQADQADPAQVARLVRNAAERLGRLDILVNNAGITLYGSIDDMTVTADVFDRQFSVNVRGVATAVRAAAPLLPNGGRIITIGSVFGSRSPMVGIGDYSATKAAVGAFTRAWARDLGSRGITVNLIQPGPIDTDLNPANSDHAPTLTAMTALVRYGKATEVAAAVVFFASPAASYVTGATLDVDGGMLA